MGVIQDNRNLLLRAVRHLHHDLCDYYADITQKHYRKQDGRKFTKDEIDLVFDDISNLEKLASELDS